MKAVAFCGSARKNGNTSILLNTALEALAAEGIETELVELAGKEIPGCKACYACFTKTNQRCAFKKDIVNDCIAKMLDADIILLGSPTYFADMSSELKALVDRAGMVGKANADMYKRKLGAAVVAVRRAGAINAFDSINHFFLIGQMIVVGSSYWNIGIGREIGDVNGDEEGLQTMTTLGENIAWLAKKIDS